jgi:hypothetical protein
VTVSTNSGQSNCKGQNGTPSTTGRTDDYNCHRNERTASIPKSSFHQRFSTGSSFAFRKCSSRSGKKSQSQHRICRNPFARRLSVRQGSVVVDYNSQQQRTCVDLAGATIGSQVFSFWAEITRGRQLWMERVQQPIGVHLEKSIVRSVECGLNGRGSKKSMSADPL